MHGTLQDFVRTLMEAKPLSFKSMSVFFINLQLLFLVNLTRQTKIIHFLGCLSHTIELVIIMVCDLLDARERAHSVSIHSQLFRKTVPMLL